jgi:putative ABC transport system permease protein
MFGVTQRKERCRDYWHVTLVTDLLSDSRYAWRRMQRHAATTMLALLTIAIGIAATTTAFSVVKGVAISGPPFPDLERITWLAEQTPAGEPAAISALNFRDWKQSNGVFETLAAWAFAPVTLNDGIEPVQVRWLAVSPGYFDVFGVAPALGRAFVQGEDEAGRDHVILLSHELWQSRYGSDRGIIGRVLRLRGEPYTVVGVMPRAASSIQWGWPQVWTPLAIAPESLTRNYHRFNAYGKLKPGVSIAAARREMMRVTEGLARAYPKTNDGWSARLQLYSDTLVGPQLKLSLSLLSAASIALLLIACFNVAGIVIADGLARDHEIATRCALGGGRARLQRQLVTEGILLSTGGGIIGVLLAAGMVASLRTFLPAFSAPGLPLPPADLVRLDFSALLVSAALSVFTGVLLSIVPAWVSCRVDLVQVMRESGIRTNSRTLGGRIRRALVMTEIVVAVVLVAVASVLGVSLTRLMRVDVGTEPQQVITATLPASQAIAFETPFARAAYLHQILDAIQRVPGVRLAALTSVLPTQGAGSEVPLPLRNGDTDDAHAPGGFFKMVTPEYFSALGLGLKQGRAFDEHDNDGGRRVTVINETLARTHFNGENAIGQVIRVPEVVAEGAARLGPLRDWEVIGIVADEYVRQLPDLTPMAGMYVPIDQSPTRHPALVVRAEHGVNTVERAVVRAVAAVNAEQAVADTQTLANMRDEAIGPDRQRTYVVGAFVVLALMLAGVGIYGVMAAMVVQRGTEMGIRASLGARERDLAGTVLKHAAGLCGIGLFIGCLAAAPILQFVETRVVGAGGLDTTLIVWAGFVLGAIAALGTAAPAYRAARIAPMQALRQN